MKPIPVILDRSALLVELRHQMARVGSTSPATGLAGPVPVCASVDRVLPAGGLARAALHEVLGAGDLAGAALGFAALALARSGGTVMWIAPDPDAWPPGLACFGLDPARLVLVRAPKPADALWAMEEALRCGAISGVLLVMPGASQGKTSHGPGGLTAGRRLMLAAEAGGGLGIMLRADSASPGPAVAMTRWRVGPLPSGGVSWPRWQVELLRSRGGTGGLWSLGWREETQLLEDEALPAATPQRRAG
jgi:protein ImuA